MNPENNSGLTINFTHDAPEYALLEKQLLEISEEAEAAYELLATLSKSNNEDQARVITAFQESIATAQDEADELGVDAPTVEEMLDATEDIPEQADDAFRILSAARRQSDSLFGQLEKYKPEKAADTLRKAQELEHTLNYDSLIEQPYMQRDWLIRTVINYRRSLEQPDSLTYEEIFNIGFTLEALSEQAREKGNLINNDEVLRKESENSSEKDLLDFMVFFKKYRTLDSTNALYASIVDALGADAPVGAMKSDDEHANQDFADVPMPKNRLYSSALQRRILRTLTPSNQLLPEDSAEYKQLLSDAEEIDSVEAAREIYLVGEMDGIPDRLKGENLIKFLSYFIPAIALEDVKAIYFSDYEKNNGIVGGTTVGSQYVSEAFGGSVIQINSPYFVRSQEKLKELLPDEADRHFVENLATTESQLVIAHEFGHALHSVLPRTTLERWEDQIKNDTTPVTDYVKKHHDHDTGHHFAEDFAETVSLFVTKPEELFEISPDRYSAMQTIYREFMPTYDESLAKWQTSKILVSSLMKTDFLSGIK
jgi:hypothetical protein